jgi:hypothetical protein
VLIREAHFDVGAKGGVTNCGMNFPDFGHQSWSTHGLLV